MTFSSAIEPWSLIHGDLGEATVLGTMVLLSTVQAPSIGLLALTPICLSASRLAFALALAEAHTLLVHGIERLASHVVFSMPGGGVNSDSHVFGLWPELWNLRLVLRKCCARVPVIFPQCLFW